MIAPSITYRKAQEAQHKKKKIIRAEVTQLKKDGDREGLVDAAKNNRRHQTRLSIAYQYGFDRDGTFDFLKKLADGNIHLLAAAVTDALLNPAKNVINFGCNTAATNNMAKLMMDFKKLVKKIMQFMPKKKLRLQCA